MKRIVICCAEFPPGPGGIGAHAYHLAGFLRNQEFSVLIHAPTRKDYNNLEFDKRSDFVIERYQPNRNLIHKLLSTLAFLFRHRSEMDHVILSGSNQLYLALILQRMKVRKILAVIHGHEILMAKAFGKRLLLRSLYAADAVVSVSQFSKRNLVGVGFRNSIEVIPNGVEVVERPIDLSARDEPREALVLVTVGSMTKRKGQHKVIRAIPALRQVFGLVGYHVIGIPSAQKELETIAEEVGVSDAVQFHGFLGDADRDDIVSKSDIFMMLSENQSDGDVEGFGIAILEANQLGIPAIGSRGTGVEESISEGVSGKLVDGNSIEQVVNAGVVVMKNYKTFSLGAKRWAKEHDWQIVGHKYLVLLNL